MCTCVCSVYVWNFGGGEYRNNLARTRIWHLKALHKDPWTFYIWTNNKSLHMLLAYYILHYLNSWSPFCLGGFIVIDCIVVKCRILVPGRKLCWRKPSFEDKREHAKLYYKRIKMYLYFWPELCILKPGVFSYYVEIVETDLRIISDSDIDKLFERDALAITNWRNLAMTIVAYRWHSGLWSFSCVLHCTYWRRHVHLLGRIMFTEK